MTACQHARVTSEVCDQTLGVSCLDCNELVAVCWADDHIPESLWNRACENDSDAKPCEQTRDDYCAICGKRIGTQWKCRTWESRWATDDLQYAYDAGVFEGVAVFAGILGMFEAIRGNPTFGRPRRRTYQDDAIKLGA